MPIVSAHFRSLLKQRLSYVVAGEQSDGSVRLHSQRYFTLDVRADLSAVRVYDLQHPCTAHRIPGTSLKIGLFMTSLIQRPIIASGNRS